MIEVTGDIAACRVLRRKVFIEEQGVSEADEIDDKDAEAIHLLARVQGEAVGTARLLRMGNTGKIGRVCVLPQMRGSGLGAALIRQGVETFRTFPEITVVKLSAQTHALAFYERLGFVAYGPEFMDAGIPHRDMKLPL